MSNSVWINSPGLRVDGDTVYHTIVDPLQQSPPDLDHEDLDDILARLHECKLSPRPKVINCDCSCSVISQTTPKKHAHIYDSSKSSDESEEDDEAFTFDQLWRTLSVHARKGTNISVSVIRNLTESYEGSEKLTDHQLNQVMMLLKHDSLAMKEGSLLVIKQLCKEEENCLYFIKHDIVCDLLYMLELETVKELHESIAFCIEKIASHHSLVDHWEDLMMTIGLQCLLHHITVETSDCVRYAVACAIRSMAAYRNLAILLLDQAMPLITALNAMSSKFKEIYTEILSNLVLHTDHTRAGVLDVNAIPVAIQMLTDGPCGPQYQALIFLKVLAQTDYGLSAVVEDNAICFILANMADSKCRKVRAAATQAMCQIMSSSRISVLKSTFVQVDNYYYQQDPISARLSAGAGIPEPAKQAQHNASSIERGVNEFSKMVIDMLCKEARIERESHLKVTEVYLKPCIDTDTKKLSHITSLVKLVGVITCLSLHRSRTGTFGQGDGPTASTFPPLKKQRRINPKLVQMLLANGCMAIVDLLYCYTDKLKSVIFNKGRQSRCSSHLKHVNTWTADSPVKTKISILDLTSIFEDAEIDLIRELLTVLLLISYCCCDSCTNNTEEELKMKMLNYKYNRDTGSAKARINKKSPRKERKAENKDTDGMKTMSSDVFGRLNVTPDILGPSQQIEQKRLWDPKNPFLTGIHRGHVASLEVELKQQEERELHLRRRKFRKCLYNEGVLECVSPWLVVADPSILFSVSNIVRCMVQPMKEKLQPRPPGDKSKPFKPRPVSANRVHDRKKQLSSALSHMSSEVASLIKNALGPLDSPVNALKSSSRPQSAKIRPQSAKDKSRLINDKGGSWKPEIDVSQPMALQCRHHVIELTGQLLLNGILSQSKVMRKHCILLMRDIIDVAEIEILMKFSQFGCMPYLVDFLRINDDDDLLEAIGLIVTRLLMTRDIRFKELFEYHGGSKLLMVLSRKSGLIKDEAVKTMKTVSNKNTCKDDKVVQTKDVWDEIMDRWKLQDKVTTILQTKSYTQ